MIGLDTLEVGSVSGSISADQLSWLAAELTADPGAPTAIFMHHPPVDIGCAWLDAIKLRNPDPFVRLVQSSPQVRLVCTGHVHLEAERKLGDATILTSPSTCVQFDPETGAEPILHHIPPGYRVLELQDDAFSTNVVRLPVLTYPPADAG